MGYRYVQRAALCALLLVLVGCAVSKNPATGDRRLYGYSWEREVEIGHVAARHASQQALSQRVSRIGVIGGAILGQEYLGVPAGDLMQLGSQAAQLIQLSYGRDDERESDHPGVEYAVKAGYRASEGAGFFSVLERMGEQEGGGLPTFLSTHPDPGQREQRIQDLAAEYTDRPDTLEVGREACYAQLAGLVWGEDPRDGFREGDAYIVPRAGYQFPAPSDWSVQKSGRGVLLVQPDQQALLMVNALEEATDSESAARRFLAVSGVEAIAQAEHRSVQPVRIEIWTAEGEGPFERIVPTEGVPTPMADLAILNQREVDAVVPAGTRLKLPRTP